MILEEIEQSLFDLDKRYLLTHCISMDLALGKGIATWFNAKYDMKNKLIKFRNQYPDYFKTFSYGFCITIDGVANLITKEKYWNKPTLLTLEESLLSLKKYVINNNIQYLGMPRIGCGLDRLDWSDVKKIIHKVFEDVDIHITVCYI